MNKKIIMFIFLTLFLIGFLLGLTKCSTGFNLNKIVGKYELIEMSDKDKSYSKEDVDKLKKLGINFTMELKKDRTGTIQLFGEDSNIKYDKNNITIENDSVPYTFKDKKIILEKNEMKMVFMKE